MLTPPAQLAADDRHAAAERDAWSLVAGYDAEPLPAALYEFLRTDVITPASPSCSHEDGRGTPVLHAVRLGSTPALICTSCLAALTGMVGHQSWPCHLCRAAPDDVAASPYRDVMTAFGRVVVAVRFCARCAAAAGVPRHERTSHA